MELAAACAGLWELPFCQSHQLVQMVHAHPGATQESWFYFLKPKPAFSDGKQVQRYGNVIIELKKDPKNAVQFKLQCNYYSGFNYSEPLSFDEFLASL